jgi:hypothetical protein
MHILFLFGALAVQLALLFIIKKVPLDNKLFAPYSLVDSQIINIQQVFLYFSLLFSVLICELHLRKQKLSVVVVLYLEVTAKRHIPHYLTFDIRFHSLYIAFILRSPRLPNPFFYMC